MCVSIKNITDELNLIGIAKKIGLVTTALLKSEMLFVERNYIVNMFTKVYHEKKSVNMTPKIKVYLEKILVLAETFPTIYDT